MKTHTGLLLAVIGISLLFISCEHSAERLAENNKQLFILGVEAINNRNWDALDELITADYVRHCQATPDVKVNSLEDFKRFLIDDAATMPDSRMTIEYLVAEGNMVAFYCTYAGTQTGQMGPFPPSNKKMSLDFAGIHRIENGKIAETWLTWDNLAALSQLGHFPPQVE